MKVWLVIAGLNGALAVALGAVAAHALSDKLDAHAMSLFETAASPSAKKFAGLGS